MVMEQRILWNEGKQLWNEYVNINGYSWSFTEEGMKKLSRILDLNIKYLKERIMMYLDN